MNPITPYQQQITPILESDGLFRAMEQLGLTRREVSDAMGISPQGFTQIVSRGKDGFSDRALKKLEAGIDKAIDIKEEFLSRHRKRVTILNQSDLLGRSTVHVEQAGNPPTDRLIEEHPFQRGGIGASIACRAPTDKYAPIIKRGDLLYFDSTLPNQGDLVLAVRMSGQDSQLIIGGLISGNIHGDGDIKISSIYNDEPQTFPANECAGLFKYCGSGVASQMPIEGESP